MRTRLVSVVSFGLLTVSSVFADDVGTAFTYQVEITDGGVLVNGDCDFEFTLWNDPVSTDPADQLGPTLTPTINIIDGRFKVNLDFGADRFTGSPRFLKIQVCCPSVCAPGYTELVPRQELLPAPYALALPALRTTPSGHASFPGSSNVIGGHHSNNAAPGTAGGTIGGGGDSGASANSVASIFATVGGGISNTASGQFSTVGGGVNNTASFNDSTVGGGEDNTASGDFSTVSGGHFNTASQRFSTVGGGDLNVASGLRSTVGGGRDNGASDTTSTVSGGQENRASGPGSTVSGGQGNMASGHVSTIGGGGGNMASGLNSTVAGGNTNVASGQSSTVGGGVGNTASGSSTSTVSGGFSNTASGEASTVAGGSTNTASGIGSTVSGGQSCTASGEVSFAAGRNAKANHKGTWVWADSVNVNLTSTGDNQFLVRASGGMWFGTTNSPSIPAGRFINTSTGAYLTTGGTWTNSSDRDKKENVTPVDTGEVLARVLSVPISRWNYKDEGQSIDHMGPMAQDFHAAFGLGDSEKSIATIDADGVAMAAIQGLYQVVQEKDAQITALQADVIALKERVRNLTAPARASTLGMAMPAITALCLVGFLAMGRSRKGGAK